MEWGEGKATFFEQVNANVIQGEKVQGTPTTSSDTHTHTHMALQLCISAVCHWWLVYVLLSFLHLQRPAQSLTQSRQLSVC